MGYIGNQQSEGFSSIPAKQDLTGATGTSLTLSHAVASSEGIDLFINNVRQESGEAYSIAGDGVTVTLTGSVVASDDIYVVYNSLALQTTVPPDGSVTKAKIGTTELDLATIKDSTGTNTAMTIDSSGRVGFNNPILFWGQLSNTSPFAPTANQLLSFRDDVDTANGWNSSNNYYVVPKAGYYEVHCMLLVNSQAGAGNLDFFINKNGVDNFIARGFTTAGASDYSPTVATVIHQFAVNDQISIQSRSTIEIWAAVNSVSSGDVSSLSIKFLG